MTTLTAPALGSSPPATALSDSSQMPLPLTHLSIPQTPRSGCSTPTTSSVTSTPRTMTNSLEPTPRSSCECTPRSTSLHSPYRSAWDQRRVRLSSSPDCSPLPTPTKPSPQFRARSLSSRHQLDDESFDREWVPQGLKLYTIQDGSLGHKAGLQIDDVITHIDGLPISTLGEAVQLLNSQPYHWLTVMRKQEQDVCSASSLTPSFPDPSSQRQTPSSLPSSQTRPTRSISDACLSVRQSTQSCSLPSTPRKAEGSPNNKWQTFTVRTAPEEEPGSKPDFESFSLPFDVHQNPLATPETETTDTTKNEKIGKMSFSALTMGLSPSRLSTRVRKFSRSLSSSLSNSRNSSRNSSPKLQPSKPTLVQKHGKVDHEILPEIIPFSAEGHELESLPPVVEPHSEADGSLTVLVSYSDIEED